MAFSVFTAIGGLLFLIVLHELGHFLIAKKLGVRVEEFGVGYPPKIFSRRFGETEYSLNLLPFGAFVRLAGEDTVSSDPRSYSAQPLLGKAAILSGGVLAFWLVAWIFYSVLAGTSGVVTTISDGAPDTTGTMRVQILGVAPGSPAQKAGLLPGDAVVSLGSKETVSTVREIQEEIDIFRGKEMKISVERNASRQDLFLEPRLAPPPNEGPVGIMLARVQRAKYPWYSAPVKGGEIVGNVTYNVALGVGTLLKSLVFDRQALKGVDVQGPVGITRTLSLSLAQGTSSFFSLLSLIAVYLAVFNLIPLPVTDGGKLLLLFVQGVTGKTLPAAVEQKMNAAVFVLLLLLMVWITIKDVANLL